MAIICLNIFNAEGEFTDYIVKKLNGIGLRVLGINFKCTNTCCIINCCVLKSSDFPTLFIKECQELNIDLNLVTWNDLFVSFKSAGRALGSSFRQSINPVATEHAADARSRHDHPMVAFKVPAYSLRTQAELFSNVKNLIFDFLGYTNGWVLRARLRISQSIKTVIITLLFPSIETVSGYAIFTTSKTHTAAFFCVIKDFLLISDSAFLFI